MFRSQFPESEGEIPTEALESVLYGFFDEQVENARRFESKEQGVSFVYSSVDSADIAKKLYEKYNGQKPEITDATEAGRTGREMIFESFITPENPGAFFTFFEQGLHHVISELPRALEDLKEGKEPKHHEVYFAGHPTRDLGHITPEFVESMKGGHGYERYGQLYAELLGAEMRVTPGIAT